MVYNWLNYWAAKKLANLFISHRDKINYGLDLDAIQSRKLTWIVIRALSELSPKWVDSNAKKLVEISRKE